MMVCVSVVSRALVESERIVMTAFENVKQLTSRLVGIKRLRILSFGRGII
jgi:hypothetical protein